MINEMQMTGHMYFGIIFFILFIGGLMILLMEYGRKIGERRKALDPHGSHEGLGPVEAAVFGLMGLMIAFTYSGASDRFEERRLLVIDETNAITTAYLRVDLLPEDYQKPVRKLFREYLETRLTTYKDIPDMAAVKEVERRAEEQRLKIWELCSEGSRQSDSPACAMVLLPAINSMIDICEKRTDIFYVHQPLAVFGVLIVMALVCSVMVGYGIAASQSKSWIHYIGFALVMVITIYVIIDMEYPRVGLITVDNLDTTLKDLRYLIK
jgi:hypothetical protein